MSERWRTRRSSKNESGEPAAHETRGHSGTPGGKKRSSSEEAGDARVAVAHDAAVLLEAVVAEALQEGPSTAALRPMLGRGWRAERRREAGIGFDAAWYPVRPHKRTRKPRAFS